MQYQKIERVRKRLLNYGVSKIVVKICNTEVITKFVNAKNNNKKNKQTSSKEIMDLIKLKVLIKKLIAKLLKRYGR